MPKPIAILEDDDLRISEMGRCLSENLPSESCIVFKDARLMIDWLSENLSEVVLISLDHDLPLRDEQGRVIDRGTGRQVADYLATFPPTCPIIVHSSNQNFAPGMIAVLEDSGWPVAQVYPFDECRWVSQGWIEQVMRFVREGWMDLSE